MPNKKNKGGGGGGGNAPCIEKDLPEEEVDMDGSDDGSEDVGGNDEDYSDTQCERADEYKKGGYHPVSVGETYNGRYNVLHKLGWGYFSTVWLAWDKKDEGFRAIKFQKSADHYREAAMDEIKLLSEIRDGDPDNTRCCTRMYDHFEHTGPHGRHVCMVFEVLGENLLSLITKYNYKGIPLPIVKQVTKKVLIGLDHIHRNLSILHTDLKPENVLIRTPPAAVRQAMSRFDPQNPDAYIPPTASSPSKSGSTVHQKRLDALNAVDTSRLNKNQKKRHRAKKKTIEKKIADAIEAAGGKDGKEEGKEDGDFQDDIEIDYGDVKLADFGNGCWTDRQFTDEIQTRQYRCPEVITGDGYSTPADMWSLAAMVFELITGDFLFDPRPSEAYERDEDHLALMIELLGGLPPVLSLGNGKFRSKFINSQGDLRHISALKFWPLEQVLSQKYKFTLRQAHSIAGFLYPMLRAEPSMRATAAEMLNHPWLQENWDDTAPYCYRPVPTGDQSGPATSGSPSGPSSASNTGFNREPSTSPSSNLDVDSQASPGDRSGEQLGNPMGGMGGMAPAAGDSSLGEVEVEGIGIGRIEESRGSDYDSSDESVGASNSNGSDEDGFSPI